eukprot:SAG31_NODE_2754_length_5137_cov_2.875645_4_plen_85_part_00
MVESRGVIQMFASLRDGHDMTLRRAIQYYEPRYTENGVQSIDGISDEHMAWLTDNLCATILRGFIRVGFLDGMTSVWQPSLAKA